MDVRDRALSAGRRLLEEAAALRLGASVPAAALRDLRLAEVNGSLAAAGVDVSPAAAAKLIETGVAPAGYSLDACNAVADYAAAAARVYQIGRGRADRGLLRLEEIVGLHALATRRTVRPAERPGEWRGATALPLTSGVVPPPAWLVPRAMSAFVERFERPPAPERPLVLWLADCYERFARIAPFATANGRVGRLILNLLLQRLGYPPVVLRRRDPRLLAAALDAAGKGDLWPSALFIAQNVTASVRALEFARARGGEALLPLGRLAAAGEAGALYKAAQRGRLRIVRKGTGIFTSKTWLDEYRTSRAAGGRPGSSSPARRNRE